MMRLSAQLPSNPLDLLADVVDDVAGFQTVWENVPCIRFDLELPRKGIRFVEPQGVLDGKTGCSEGADVVEEDRHMDVGSPFPCFGAGPPGSEGVFQIQEPRELTVLLLIGLSEVDRFRVFLESIHTLLRDLRYVDRCGLLKLKHGNARIHELL